MMMWNGMWPWVWLMMVPTLAIVAALVVLVMRQPTPPGLSPSASALQLLDQRLAAGAIDVEAYRFTRAEIDHRA
jgi:uncharacterized membrane protein